MLRRYKVTGIGDPKPPKKKKAALMLLLAFVATVPALSLLKTSVLANNKNVISVNTGEYNIVADLDGGTFEPGSKPEFTKMDNGEYVHKYKPIDKEVTIQTPIKDGCKFIGWNVNGSSDLVLDYTIPKWNNKNVSLKANWETSNPILLKGEEFNTKIKAMSSYSNIRTISFNKGIPKWNGVDLSEKQDGSITGTITGNTLNINCEDEMFANSNSSSMFYDFTKITSITFNNFNTSKVTNMSSMFGCCFNLSNLDVTKFDTSNVTDMGGMFQSCNNLTNLNVSNFNTSKVTIMNHMFTSCSGLSNLDVTKFDTSNVTDMGYIFFGCSKLTSIDVSKFDTSSVADISYMFCNCRGLTSLDVTKFNTSNVVNMCQMFSNCNKLTNIDLSSFNTSKVDNMYSMFDGCYNLTNLDLSNFNTSKVTHMHNMFKDCSRLSTLDLSTFNTANVINMSGLFNGCSGLTDVNISQFDTIKVTRMEDMFRGCSKLTSLDVSSFNTTNTVNMDNMFNGCSSLVTLDLSTFNTQNTTDMWGVFMGCSKLNSSITISNSGISSRDYTNIFKGCSSDINAKFIVKYISPETKEVARKMVATKNPEDHVYLYEEPSILLKGSEFNAKVKPMDSFDNVRVINFNKGSVNSSGIDLSEKQDGSITGTITGDTLNINCEGNIFANSDCYSMFYFMRNLNSIVFNNFDTSNVTGMSGMFEGCSNLTNLNVSNFDTSNVTNMSEMFDGCSNLTNLDLSSFNTSNVTNMSEMFYHCRNLTNLDVSNFDTSRFRDMNTMFSCCERLTNLDVSNFDTARVRDMSYMFSHCYRLTNLDLSNFDTSKVDTMFYMFNSCSSLTNLNISNFDTSKVDTMHYMFENCSKLKSSIIISNSNTSRYYDMFKGCSTTSGSRFTVNYKSGCRDLAQGMVDTKSPNSNVVLGRQVRTASDKLIKEDASSDRQAIPAPKPVTITLHNGVMAQVQEERRVIQNGIVGYLGEPELNPQYSGVFGGYYYDEACTIPVKPTDLLTQDTEIYARW